MGAYLILGWHLSCVHVSWSVMEGSSRLQLLLAPGLVSSRQLFECGLSECFKQFIAHYTWFFSLKHMPSMSFILSFFFHFDFFFSIWVLLIPRIL